MLGGNLTVGLLVRAIETVAELTAAIGGLHPPELVFYDSDRNRVTLPDRS
jgi:hypothetical protein